MTSFAPLGRIFAVLALLSAAHEARAAAALSASVVVQSSTTVCVGNNVLVTLTVSNTGDAAADSVTAYFGSNTTSGAAVTVTGPNPALDPSVVLNPGDSVVFSWTAVGSAAGNVSFSASAAGKDIVAVTNTVSGRVTSTTVALTALRGTVSGPTAPVSTGQAFSVTIAVTNWTSGPVSTVTPKIRVSTSPASVALLSGPSPATVDLLDPGASQTFTWSYNPTSTAGVVTFSVSAAGTPTCGTLSLVGGSVSTSVQTAAALSVTMFANTVTATGMPVTVLVTVTNTGLAQAILVKPASVTVSATGGTVTGTPAVSASVNLDAAQIVTFTFTYTAGTVGKITFSTTVTANDKNSGTALTKFVSYTLLGGTLPPNVAARLAYERADAGAGQSIRLILSVTNTGGSTLTGLTAALATSGAVTVDAASTPASLAALAARASATFTWNAVTLNAGTLVFYASVAGASSAGPVTAQTSATLPGIAVPDAGASYVFPSPAGDTARIAYVLTGSGTVKIRIYNAVGDKVATAEDTGKGAGLQFTDLDTAKLASGVYFYFVDVTYDAGTTEKQKKRKFVVLH